MCCKRWQLCILAAMLILCGCAQRDGNVSELAVSSQQAGQEWETEAANESEDGNAKTEKSGKNEKTPNTYHKITVIDTLPEVDESIPRELTPLPSSEVINIIGQKDVKKRIWQEDGSFTDEQFSVYNVICHDHDISFAMPKDGQIIWRGSGVSVRYIGDKEREVIKELDEKNVVGDDCEEFNESMAKTRQLIREGFLQDEFERYLSNFSELGLEDCWQALLVFMQTFHGNPYFYRVKEGDTLYGIAEVYLRDGDGYLRLANINELSDPDFIYPGQLLEIPVKKY